VERGHVILIYESYDAFIMVSNSALLTGGVTLEEKPMLGARPVGVGVRDGSADRGRDQASRYFICGSAVIAIECARLGDGEQDAPG
jgi:hypothetical protein